MTTRTRTPGEFTGWHMLAILIAFFGVVIAVNVYMSWSAISTWTGLVVENSYVASQEFNAKLKTANARIAAGWRGGLAYDEGKLVFTLVDAKGAPVALGTVTVEVNRPVGVTGDRTLTLEKQADGSHTVATALDDGVWNAEIAAEVPGETVYEHHARLIVGAAQ